MSAVHDNSAHANQRLILDGAGVHDRAMSNSDQFPDDSAESVGHMDDGAVLDVGACADVYGVDVAAQCRAEPYAAFFAQGHCANNGRVGGYKCAVGDGGLRTQKVLNAFGEGHGVVGR